MEEVEKAHEWESLEAEIRNEFDRLEKANNDLGNEYDQQVEFLRNQVDTVIRSRDVRQGRATLKEISSVFFAVTMIYQLLHLIDYVQKNFETIQWKDAARARQLIRKGKEISSENPTVDALRPIAGSILDLMVRPSEVGPGLSV